MSFALLVTVLLLYTSYDAKFSYSFVYPSITKRVTTTGNSVDRCFLDNGRSRDRIILGTKTKKSGSGGGSTTSQSTSKKVQVKLLKYVAGTGHAGQVIQVAPAFYNNKLRPTKSAIIISDEEVKQEQADAILAEKKRQEIASELKELFDSTSLVFRRKSGLDGHLFGGVGPKAILESLTTSLQTNEHRDFLNEKSVKIVSISNEESDDEVKGDIKRTGLYSIKVALTPDVIGKVAVEVKSDK
jgi:ribosomal protein L9